MPRAPDWTPAEDAILRQKREAGCGDVETVAALPGRSLCAVQNRARKLGLTHSRQDQLKRLQAGREAAKARGVAFGRKKGCKGQPWSEETRRKATAAIRARLADPEFKARRDAAVREAVKRMDHAAKGRKGSETRLAWCPVHLRPAYHQLYRNKHVPAAQARILILEEWAGQVARALRQIAAVVPLEAERRRKEAEAAFMAKHDRLMAKVAQGKAKLVTVQAMPSAPLAHSPASSALALLS